jgi:hypothetical protein
LIEVLTFVNDQKGLFVLPMEVDQVIFQENEEFTFAFETFVHSKRVGYKIEKIHFGQAGVGNHRHKHIFSKAVDKGIEQGGFSGAHISGQQQKALIVQDTVFQDSQCLLVLFAKP